MPNVGGKEFPYTEQGMAQAEAYAAETGMEVLETPFTMKAAAHGNSPMRKNFPSAFKQNGPKLKEKLIHMRRPKVKKEHGDVTGTQLEKQKAGY